MENKKNLLLGCSGSVASIRLIQLINAFKTKFNIKIILTQKAKFFTDKLIKNYKEFELEEKVEFYFDEDEWSEYEKNKKVLHVEVYNKIT